mmetsp:Transcript_20898/g.49393  ORF Transcript_20898/g.49393 Transcript_20898/m.49393 type:complete len:272 (-) Transcript_20898:1343-2158(-)
MTKVSHDRHVSLAFVADAAEEGDKLIGVLVGRETLGPEAQRASTNAKILDVGEEIGVEERFQVLGQGLGLHNHRVTTGHKNIRHLLVLGEVIEERGCLLLSEPELVVTDKLGPAEEVRAVSVTSLRRCREHEDSLAVFVLNAIEVVSVLGSIERLLTGWMGVEIITNLANYLDEELGIAGIVSSLEFLPVPIGEHIESGKHQLVKRILGDIFGFPIDKLVDVVRARLEGEYQASKLDVTEVGLELRVVLGDLVDGLQTDGLVAFIGLAHSA